MSEESTNRAVPGPAAGPRAKEPRDPFDGCHRDAGFDGFHLIADHTRDIIYRYRFKPEPAFEYVSPAAFALTGYTPEDHYADPELGLKIVHPNDRDRLQAFNRGAREYDEPLTLRWIRKDGDVVWVEQRNVPICDGDEVVAVVGIARDVTHQKELEERLRQSEERHRAHFDNLPHPAYTWQLRGDELVMIGSNAAARRLAGERAEDLYGIAASEMYAGDPEVVADLRRCIDGRTVLTRQLRSRMGVSSDPRDILASYVFVPPDIAVVHVEDVSERKATERQLRWMKFALDQAGDAIFWIDERGDISYVNDATCTMLGYSRVELTSMCVFDLDIHFEPEEWGERWAYVRRAGHAMAETRYRARDGSAVPVEISSSHLALEGQEYHVAFVRDISERKRAQDELRGQKEFIEKVLDNLPIGLAVSSVADGRGKYANKRFEEIYGWPLRKMRTLDEFFRRVFPDEGARAEIKRRFLDDIGSGDPERMRWSGIEVTSQDGRKRVVDAVNIPLPEHGLMISTVQDVTERTLAEEQLRLSHSILQNVGNLVIVADRAGQVFYVSPSVTRLLGYSPAELLGDGWWKLTYNDPEEAAREREYESRVAVGERPARRLPYEREIRARDGTARWFLWHDSPGPGNLVIGVAHEITERKRAEEEVRSAWARAQQYLDVAGVMLLVLDRQAKITLINRKGAEVLGYEEEELIGRDWFETCLPEERHAELRTIWEGLMRGELGGPSEYEHPVVTRSGDRRLIAWTNVVLRDPDGRAVGILGSGEDITERRSLEEQLRLSQRMEAVGRLAGGVAHDFNNLLTVILGDTELALKDAGADGRLRELLGEVMEAGERAASLTRQLLVFSRRQVVEPTVFSLNDLVAEVEKMLRRLIEEDIELTTRRAPDLGLVNADRGQIEQVLVNLVVNARDAMPFGGRLVVETDNVTLDEAWAAAHPGARAGEYVLLAVTDTGTGMTDDVKAHLFEPFFTTKERGTGTGLGLATSYGIVQKHGGYIGVYSREGVGTTMAVYLPRAEDEPAGGAQFEAINLPRGEETILLVEDEVAVRRVATRLLEGQGYTVLDAADGFEALRVLEQYRGGIDLLLTDVVLPGMSGRELAEKVRTEMPQLRVLFCSGYTDDVMVERQFPEWGEQLVQKPFTIQELACRVRGALDA
jgi:PAS domain S-box-containing protein